MFDLSCVERAPRAFRIRTGLGTVYVGYGDAGEEFISGYHDDIDEYHVSYKDEYGKWHDTRNTADWPVFDRLFGKRGYWQIYCSAMGDCARRVAEAGLEL